MAVHRLHQSTPAELMERIAAERRGTPFLELRDGDGRQRIVALSPERSPLTVGRQAASDVALDWDEEVSRAHADIECIGDVWTLVDDGRSRNGSFVNGERVLGRRALRHGDVLAIGRTRIAFIAPMTAGDHSTAAGARGAPPALTPAQRRVLVALCRPFGATRFATPPSNRELAEELSLSVETVKFHLHVLFEMFGVADLPQRRKRAALAQRALEEGIVGRPDLLEPA